MVKILGAQEFQAIGSDNAVNNSIFLDEDNTFKTKDNTGTVSEIGGSSSSSSDLGEVKMFALSMTGAVTKATLQSKGWAICDGTTPSSQGISDATITSTPDLQNKFIRMSDDETSGTTGGSETHNHGTGIVYDESGIFGIDTAYCSGGAVGGGDYFYKQDYGSRTADGGRMFTSNTNTIPPYYEMAFFMKVK